MCVRVSVATSIPVGEAEQQIIEHCNGSKSVAEIFAALDSEVVGDSQRIAKERTCDFIGKVQVINAAMFFGQKWETANGR